MTTSDLALPKDPLLAIQYILLQYQNGYYPYYHFESKHYYWDRQDTRTILRLTPKVTEKADRMLAKIPEPYVIEENRHVELVLALLANEQIKKNSWVHGEVVDVYQHLAANGYLKTFEATSMTGFAGAVLGIDLPKLFIVETMVTVQSNGSKTSLCYLVKKYASLGYQIIDVQSPHKKEHPCARLFEETISLSAYLDLLKRVLI